MKYSTDFYGWVGKTAMDFTYSSVHELSIQLAKHYKSNSSSGQKIMIGYDPRFLAKEFADYIACVMASKGIKVFLSNRMVPSSVLLFSSLQKKSMGAIVITGDEFDAGFLGIRAFDAKGYPLDEEKIGFLENKKKKENELLETSVKKWIQKGFIEPFDPSICFENHIEEKINFHSIVPSSNRILFNPLFGSSMLYFDCFLSRKEVHGYTIDNEKAADLKGIEPIPSTHKTQLYEDMLIKGAELGFILSPDGTTFEFLVGPKILTTEEIILLLAEHLIDKSEKNIVFITNEYRINDHYMNDLGLELIFVDKEDFVDTISSCEHLFAVDHLGRFYLESHGAADALMVGYYLIEIFNNKALSPSSLHRKFETIHSLLND